MSINLEFEDIFEAYKIIAKQNGSRSCFKESIKGAAKAGVVTGVGGLIFGPTGMLVGGIAGTLIAYWTCKQYDSLYIILVNMSENDKRKLEGHMIQLFRKNGSSIRNGAALIALVKGKDKMSLTEIQKFLEGLQDFVQQHQRKFC